MKPTNLNARKLPKRQCVHCGVSYEDGNAKKQFCSVNCRVAHHRQMQSLTIQQQSQTVDEQIALIDELTSAPIRRTESVRIVNPAWTLANQAYLSQQARCSYLERQLSSIEQKAQALQAGKMGSYIGLAIGTAMAITWLANRHDDRKVTPLGTAAIVSFAIRLIAYSLVGYCVGRAIHRSVVVHQPQTIDLLEDLASQSAELKIKLHAEQSQAEKLRQKLDQLARYEKETVTSLDEVRVHEMIADK